MTNLGHKLGQNLEQVQGLEQAQGNENYPAGLKVLVIGALIISGMVLVMDMNRKGSLNNPRQLGDECQGEVNMNAKISKEQFAQFITIPEPSAKASVQDILQQPYCPLAAIEVRAGAKAERVAYRFESRPQLWLIVLYEGDDYVSYNFRIQEFGTELELQQ